MRNDEGCLFCISHKMNEDGYFRKTWAVAGKRVAEMFHRFIYRAHKGEIPEGFEVDHMCNNRGCCEPSHLQAIDGTAHAVKSNSLRYADRYAQAQAHWETTRCTGSDLAELFGVTFSTGCRWVRSWGGGRGATA